MSALLFSSQYGASVWDIALVDETKKNLHSCGAYTANNLDKVSRMAMRNDTREKYQPLLAATLSECASLKETVAAHQVILDILVKDTCLDADKLIELASHTSANKGETWPYKFEAQLPDKPATILFAQVFEIFDRQCVVVDSLMRTRWLEPSKGKQLHKKLVSPIRKFMQSTAASINKVKREPTSLVG